VTLVSKVPESLTQATESGPEAANSSPRIVTYCALAVPFGQCEALPVFLRCAMAQLIHMCGIQ